MTHTIDLAPEGQAPTMWRLRRLTHHVSPLEDMSVCDCELQLDRGNAEFGMLCSQDVGTFTVAPWSGDKPTYFKASDALAVCHRYGHQGGAAMKVCVLMPTYQVDLEFEDAVHAQCFISALKGLATNALTVYEAPRINAFMDRSFRIKYLPEYCAQKDHSWSDAVDPTAEMSRLWGLDDLSDFVVTTGTSSFKVHKAVLSLRSQFFRNACKPGFLENTTNSIHLVEDAPTVETLLKEIYGVQNHITGSIFTTFARAPAIKIESTMHTLLSLFIAADKYDLNAIKRRAATAFTDRLHFLTSSKALLGLAASTLATTPERDFGLRDSIVRLVWVHLPAIMEMDCTREELLRNELVCGAVLGSFAGMVREGALVIPVRSASGLLTPPASPVKKRKWT